MIITTHNPLFVHRKDLCANYIVDGGEVHKAKNITELRQVLEVWPSDNLLNAELVIVVEGENDELALKKILPLYSSKIANALSSGRISFMKMCGVHNLQPMIHQLQMFMCKYVFLFDFDQAAKEAIEIHGRDLTPLDYRFAKCFKGAAHESEFEDMLQSGFYLNIFNECYGTNFVANADFEVANNKKWSLRIEDLITQRGQGIDWRHNESIKEFKNRVANGIAQCDCNSKDELLQNVLDSRRAAFMSGFVQLIETKIN